MMPSALLIKLLLVAGLVAGAVGGIAWWRSSLIAQGRDEAQQVCQQEKDAADKEAQSKTTTLQAEVDDARKGMTNAVQALNHKYSRIIAGLRQRASRAEANAAAGDGSAAGQCDGTGLYREDGEFLAGEAARAELLRAELQRCYTQYDRAREAVKE